MRVLALGSRVLRAIKSYRNCVTTSYWSLTKNQLSSTFSFVILCTNSGKLLSKNRKDMNERRVLCKFSTKKGCDRTSILSVLDDCHCGSNLRDCSTFRCKPFYNAKGNFPSYSSSLVSKLLQHFGWRGVQKHRLMFCSIFGYLLKFERNFFSNRSIIGLLLD